MSDKVCSLYYVENHNNFSCPSCCPRSSQTSTGTFQTWVYYVSLGWENTILNKFWYNNVNMVETSWCLLAFTVEKTSVRTSPGVSLLHAQRLGRKKKNLLGLRVRVSFELIGTAETWQCDSSRIFRFFTCFLLAAIQAVKIHVASAHRTSGPAVFWTMELFLDHLEWQSAYSAMSCLNEHVCIWIWLSLVQVWIAICYCTPFLLGLPWCLRRLNLD